jgi:hypothetical protein
MSLTLASLHLSYIVVNGSIRLPKKYSSYISLSHSRTKIRLPVWVWTPVYQHLVSTTTPRGGASSRRTLIHQVQRRSLGVVHHGLSVVLVLTVNSCIKVRLDLQADKSTVVVKGPFFPRVVNPRYRIRGTMCNTRIQSSKARKAIVWRTKLHLIY